MIIDIFIVDLIDFPPIVSTDDFDRADALKIRAVLEVFNNFLGGLDLGFDSFF